MPDLKNKVPDLGTKVPDPNLEVPDLRSGGIRLNLTPERGAEFGHFLKKTNLPPPEGVTTKKGHQIFFFGGGGKKTNPLMTILDPPLLSIPVLTSGDLNKTSKVTKTKRTSVSYVQFK